MLQLVSRSSFCVNMEHASSCRVQDESDLNLEGFQPTTDFLRGHNHVMIPNEILDMLFVLFFSNEYLVSLSNLF